MQSLQDDGLVSLPTTTDDDSFRVEEQRKAGNGQNLIATVGVPIMLGENGSYANGSEMHNHQDDEDSDSHSEESGDIYDTPNEEEDAPSSSGDEPIEEAPLKGPQHVAVPAWSDELLIDSAQTPEGGQNTMDSSASNNRSGSELTSLASSISNSSASSVNKDVELDVIKCNASSVKKIMGLDISNSSASSAEKDVGLDIDKDTSSSSNIAAEPEIPPSLSVPALEKEAPIHPNLRRIQHMKARWGAAVPQGIQKNDKKDSDSSSSSSSDNDSSSSSSSSSDNNVPAFKSRQRPTLDQRGMLAGNSAGGGARPGPPDRRGDPRFAALVAFKEATKSVRSGITQKENFNFKSIVRKSRQVDMETGVKSTREFTAVRVNDPEFFEPMNPKERRRKMFLRKAKHKLAEDLDSTRHRVRISAKSRSLFGSDADLLDDEEDSPQYRLRSMIEKVNLIYAVAVLLLTSFFHGTISH